MFSVFDSNLIKFFWYGVALVGALVLAFCAGFCAGLLSKRLPSGVLAGVLSGAVMIFVLNVDPRGNVYPTVATLVVIGAHAGVGVLGGWAGRSLARAAVA